MNPKIASAQRPSDRIKMKKTPMIALNRVSVFAATIEATDRLFGGSGSPSFSRRRAASLDGPSLEAASISQAIDSSGGRGRGYGGYTIARVVVETSQQGEAEALSVSYRDATKVYPRPTHPPWRR